MRAAIIKWGIGCLLGLLAFTSQASEQWLTENHPDTYVVQPGDTLWDIAGRFLNDPWRWQEVWQASDVENPHLIYPGDIIHLTMEQGEPRLSVRRNSHDQYEQTTYVNGEKVVKLSPRIRSMPAQSAIPTIPLSVIGPFLTRTKVTSVGELDQEHEISAVDDERLLVSEGSRFYASGLSNNVGDALSIFRPGRILIHPKTGESLGQEAIYLGTAEVAVSRDMSTLILLKGVEEIRAGDKLLPLEKDRLEPYFFPKLPEGDAKGYILSVLGGVNQIGQHQVIVISGGKDVARAEGDVLQVFQKKKDLLTRVKSKEDFEKRLNKDAVEQLTFAPFSVGRIIVFKVYDKTSLALVMDATRPMYLGDELDMP